MNTVAAWLAVIVVGTGIGVGVVTVTNTNTDEDRSGWSTEHASVPEPGTLALLLSGMGLLALRIR